MNKILILFAHPLFEKSRVHQALVKAIPKSPNIRFHDLYESYPDFNINVPFEKDLLLQHDVILWQHPVYWYSIPALLKQWIDMVLEYRWAYGPGGNALAGKIIVNVVSAGARSDVYATEGRNRYTLKQFFAPLEQTALLCNMTYLSPFAVYGTHLLKPGAIADYAARYHRFLEYLENAPLDQIRSFNGEYQNDIMT